jgi:endoglucanase
MLGTTDRQEWKRFCQRFTTAEGRVVDTFQAKISTSESQAYGLLAAEACGDSEAFQRILGWTRQNLRVRGDMLHAWRWDPATTPQVKDRQAATDGDLVIAWALLRAARRWQRADWQEEALRIAADIRAKLVTSTGFMLLPGEWGWAADKVVFNPSYVVAPALMDLHAAWPAAQWDEVLRAGLQVIRLGAAGRHGLPPDWLELVAGTPAPVPWRERKPPAFGFDALRVPLHLAWAGLAKEPAVAAAGAFWAAKGAYALHEMSPDRVRTYEGNIGIAAIASLTKAALAGRPNLAQVGSVANAHYYFDAALSLLVRIARVEAPGSAPVS